MSSVTMPVFTLHINIRFLSCDSTKQWVVIVPIQKLGLQCRVTGPEIHVRRLNRNLRRYS